MGEAILLGLQALAFMGILHPRRLQILQQLLLPLALPLQVGPAGAGLLEGLFSLLPGPVGQAPFFQKRKERRSGKAVEPAPLLAGPGQVLGLPLHSEIDQERAQLQDLRPTHRHPLEPMAAAELALLEAPLPADQELQLV